MSIIKLHPEHRVWQCFSNRTLNFNDIFFGHLSSFP
jgi:hypothetical protein